MHRSAEAEISGSELDRQQIRRALRQMGNESIFYLLDDAISLLPQGAFWGQQSIVNARMSNKHPAPRHSVDIGNFLR